MSKTYQISRFAMSVADPIRAMTYGQKAQEIQEKSLERAVALFCLRSPDEYDGVRTLYVREKPRNFAESLLGTASITEVKAQQTLEYQNHGKQGVTLRAHFTVTSRVLRKGKALKALLESEDEHEQLLLEAADALEREDAEDAEDEGCK